MIGSTTRPTLLTGATLLVVAAIAWVGVFAQASAGMAMVDTPSVADALGFVASWSVMMAAMMLPSATPMIALYGAIRRGPALAASRPVPTALFAAVYLVVWAALGLPVYLASLAVQSVADDSAAGRLLPYALGVVLVLAGAYQLSPLKQVCLRGCRNPLSFLLQRSGVRGAAGIRLALDHALYCLGCCWALMVVFVAAGAMALSWVLLVAGLVFVEKLLPLGEWTARLIGAALIGLGLLVLIDPGLAMALRGMS